MVQYIGFGDINQQAQNIGAGIGTFFGRRAKTKRIKQFAATHPLYGLDPEIIGADNYMDIYEKDVISRASEGRAEGRYQAHHKQEQEEEIAKEGREYTTFEKKKKFEQDLESGVFEHQEKVKHKLKETEATHQYYRNLKMEKEKAKLDWDKDKKNKDLEHHYRQLEVGEQGALDQAKQANKEMFDIVENSELPKGQKSRLYVKLESGVPLTEKDLTDITTTSKGAVSGKNVQLLNRYKSAREK